MKNTRYNQNSRPTLYILDPSKDITGAFICAKNEAHLIYKDFEVVLVLPTISKISDSDLVNFSKVIRLPIYDVRKSIGSLLLYFPALLISGWKLRQAMKKDGCQYLQVNDYYLMQGVVARLFGYRGQIVTWVRIDHTRYGSFFSRYWLRYTYRVSDTVVTVSKFILNKLPKSDKNRLVYDPVVDVSKQVSNNKDNKVRKLIYISNYMDGKGHQYAIQAFEKIAAEFADVELHFYGGDMGLDKNKKYKKKLQLQSKDLTLENRIIFHEFVRDTQSILKEGYMALNFSESESFSMTCLEASQAGLSVVAARSGGPEEIIVDSETGYLVDVGDIDAMTEAIKKLLVNSDRNRKFGENGALYVRKTFSAEEFKNNIQDIFTGDDQ